MEKKICPYPGLRPFTEDESIFFKGRDLHIRQIINQLEQKKIIIITGASGDGKSSLVYAGVVPNARAGFFKSEYNNWLIADFRPERNPLNNLSKTLADNLKINYENTYNELKEGFSSIIQLYKNSQFYISKESNNWKNANKQEQKQQKSKGANLLILADQFEEFFTNTENFQNGNPSIDAYTTVNLLLETARIAINENLPVYVVFTMRSDFISQCVAFKDLPEFIGFSQFFVPRLKRNEIQQVIEEPASLSGGKITNRLTESIINELGNGFDQLPVLQHTLNQLWKIADNGNTEIDMIHMAKLAGLPDSYLAEEDKIDFQLWFNKQPDYKKKYYKNATISNVLNTHANILYESAYKYFKDNIDWADKQITVNESKLILKTVFKSLTKIDSGRAVRNRMTLNEITNIINQPNITFDTVCGVINIFRHTNNTFVRPFLFNNDIESQYLSGDEVLDITHEALIRNWELLKEWEKEEYENLTDYYDLRVQLDRWIDSDKSNEFLLPLGPLSYFEEWFKRCEPNSYWIAKYNEKTISKDEKLRQGEETYEQIIEYLETSRQTLIAADLAKKRRRNILTFAAMIVIFILSGITYWAIQEQQNAFEQKKLADNRKEIAEQREKEAILAKQDAEQKEKQALLAKKQADSAKQVAKKNMLIAQNQAKKLQKQAIALQIQKNQILEQQDEIIAKNKKIQENLLKIKEEKRLAEIARDSAEKMSQLTLSKSLAHKAKSDYEDKDLNSLLALHAYDINQKNDGDPYDPEMYDAMRFAAQKYDASNTLELNTGKIMSFYIDEDNFLYYLNIEGTYYKYDLNKKEHLDSLKLFGDIAHVEKAYFIKSDYLIVSLKNKENYLYDFKNNDKTELKGHIGFINAIAISLDYKYLATGGRDKIVNVWNLNELKRKPQYSDNFKSRVKDLVFNNDVNTLYIALDKGELVSWQFLNNKDKEYIKEKKQIQALTNVNDNYQIAFGFINGSFSLYNPNIKSETKNKFIGQSRIEDLIYDKATNIIAAATADRKIALVHLSNLNNPPITIEEKEQKITKLTITSTGRVYALTEAHKIKYWESSTEAYAKILRKNINREFTQEEWKLFAGEKFKFNKLNVN